VPGDEIIGFVTRTRGVSIHRKDCVNIINEDEKERLIEVDWGQAGLTYPVTVVVDAWNRVGLAHDITEVVAAEKVNIANMNVAEKPDQQAAISITIDIQDLGQLSRVLSRIESVRGVINVTRSGEGRSVKPSQSS
jgi:GTP pyrophosphokinase